VKEILELQVLRIYTRVNIPPCILLAGSPGLWGTEKLTGLSLVANAEVDHISCEL
jgi:hypothetical protein